MIVINSFYQNMDYPEVKAVFRKTRIIMKINCIQINI